MATIVKLIFWVVIPGIIIYFRAKKKFKTGFAIGFVLTSLLLGLLVSASMQVSPFDAFINNMNSNNYEQAEKDLRVILQGNPNDIRLIDETKIINRVKYKRMKKKLYDEYIEIAETNLAEIPVKEYGDCKKIVKARKNNAAMDHALRMLHMAEAIGPEKKELEKEIIKKRDSLDKVLDVMNERCM